MTDTLDRQIQERLRNARSIVVVSHIRPDADAVGSLLGLGLALLAAGKQVQLVLQDGLPEKYAFLPGADRVARSIESGFDSLITLDCSDLKRTGSVLEGLPAPDLNIDHHQTNLNFGKINLVVADASATALVLAEHLPRWGLMVDADAAQCLLAGILGDTIGFRTSSTDARTLRMAAELMDKGANLPLVYRETLLSRSIPELRYWGQGLTRIEHEDKLLWTALTLDDRIKAVYPENDDADLINLLSSVSGLLVVVLFIQQTPGRVKVSWRSAEGIDVSTLAFEFGGGGHAAAAGADVEGSLDEVVSKVLHRTRQLLAAE
ncbi:MAG: DHH family phosphoesterase [Anaerolineaceae bacterium]